MVKKHFRGSLQGRRLAIWGLAFKPNTDDMREAPSVVVIRELLDAGARVCAYDPEAMDECKKRYLGDRIEYAPGPIQALEGADALVLVTEWNEFRRPDFEAVKAALRQPVVFDGRNVYPRKTLEELGFTYYGIGR
jgi:UDPglucose 6-dehydrogenase